MYIETPNAFIQIKMSAKKRGKRLIMKVRGKLVDWLIELEPTTSPGLLCIGEWSQGYLFRNA